MSLIPQILMGRTLAGPTPGVSSNIELGALGGLMPMASMIDLRNFASGEFVVFG